MTAVYELQKYLPMYVSRLVVDYTFNKTQEEHKHDFDNVVQLLESIWNKAINCNICWTFIENDVVTKGQCLHIHTPKFSDIISLKILLRQGNYINIHSGPSIFLNICTKCASDIQEVHFIADWESQWTKVPLKTLSYTMIKHHQTCKYKLQRPVVTH